MLLDTTNGHNSAIVDKFNKLAEKFDSYGLLEIILNNFCDDGDLQEIINILEERMEQHSELLATKKKDAIETMLVDIWTSIGMDIPNNFEDIVQFCYEDVCDTADAENWHSGDVVIAFRRWIEGERAKN
jgi:hypothetical protein